MTILGRAILMLALAGAAGMAGVPILAIMFTVVGLLLLDIAVLSGLFRMLFGRK